MIKESNCDKRGCVNYIGVIQPDGTEKTEVHSCKAFPEGIPSDISFGSNKHLVPVPGQGNIIVFKL